MLHRWTTLAVTTGTAALLTVGVVLADDKVRKDTPLARIMRQVDEETKVVRDGVKTIVRFRKTAKEVSASSTSLAKLAEESRPFTEPAKEFKKPQELWGQLTDKLVEASGEMAKAAEKGDFNEARKAWTSLNNTCTNCHGAFRPSNEDEPF